MNPDRAGVLSDIGPWTEPSKWRTQKISRDVREDYPAFTEADLALFDHLYHREIRIPEDYQDLFPEETAWMHDHWGELALGDIPLVVLTAGVKDPTPDDHYSRQELLSLSDRLQRGLLTLSTESRQVIVAGSGHQIQVEAPERVIEEPMSLTEMIRDSNAQEAERGF